MDKKKYEVFIGNKSGDGLFFGVEADEKRLQIIIDNKKLEVMRLYYVSPDSQEVRIKEVDEFGKNTVVFS